MVEKIKKFYEDNMGDEQPMRVRLFNWCTLGGTFGAFLATMAPLISGVHGEHGLLFASLTILFFFCLFLAGYITKKYDRCIWSGVIGLNFVIYPLLYFTMGGIKGGMALYFIMGVIFSLLLLDIKQILFVFPIEAIWYIFVFQVGVRVPEVFSTIENIDNLYVNDTAADFLIVSLTTTFVIKILYGAYEKQQARSDKLVKELEELSITDPLTKVYNRRHLMQALEIEMTKSKREDYSLSIIMFDIDKFKNINDTYGHVIGDEVLIKFAEILSTNCREYDMVARYGGEEFVLILPRTSSAIAFERAEEIRAVVERTGLSKCKNVPVTVSGGVAYFDSNNMKTIDDFVAVADTYLYKAKENGRNRIIWIGNEKELA